MASQFILSYFLPLQVKNVTFILCTYALHFIFNLEWHHFIIFKHFINPGNFFSYLLMQSIKKSIHQFKWWFTLDLSNFIEYFKVLKYLKYDEIC